jgi:hypothetical protein
MASPFITIMGLKKKINEKQQAFEICLLNVSKNLMFLKMPVFPFA